MQQGGSVLLSTAFFAPVYYFHYILQAGEIFIEKHENFIKQTYRNRCVIEAANGALTLTVPVENGRSSGVKITDTRIANHLPWQRNHWRSLQSAYGNSPFFDFIADDIEPFFSRKYDFLFDYNCEITRTLLSLLDIKKDFGFTEAFEQMLPHTCNLREKISPKIKIEDIEPDYVPVVYTQVFEDKFPFIPNLSILDLLFCTGPEAKTILAGSFI